MNCDEAFDQMTLPGEHDQTGLRRHLRRCPRCRAMQETLSPAIAWLSAGANPDGDMPGDAGSAAMFLTEDAVQVAERAAHRLGTRRTAIQRRGISRWTLGAGIALSGLVAVALLACFMPLFDSPSSRVPAAGFSTQGSVCLWKMPADGYSRTPPTADQLIATCAACHLASR